MNAPIQSSAVDMFSFSMFWSAEDFQKQDIDAQCLLHLHDEIGVICRNDHIEAANNIMEYNMTTRLKEFSQFSIPLLTDTEIVRRWSDKHLKEE